MEEKLCSVCGSPLVCGEIILSYITTFQTEELKNSYVAWLSKKNLQKYNSMRISGEKKACHCPKCRTITFQY